jgi:hypothetical protein
MTHDEMHFVAVNRFDDGIAVFQRQRHRLLDDDVLATFGGENRMLAVKLVRRGNIDRLDVRALAHLPCIFESGRTEVAGECSPRIGLRIGRGDDPNAPMQSGGVNHDRSGHPEADDA